MNSILPLFSSLSNKLCTFTAVLYQLSNTENFGAQVPYTTVNLAPYTCLSSLIAFSLFLSFFGLLNFFFSMLIFSLTLVQNR